MNSESAKAAVRRYYAAVTRDYLLYYGSRKHHHMHYGFDRDLEPGGDPMLNLVRYLEQVAGLGRRQAGPIEAGAASGESRPGIPEIRILDAGCGVGGSSIHLARSGAFRVLGLTLSEPQARLARGFAAKGEKAARPRFLTGDFTVPPFKPASFDLLWALESFDHAPDKRACLREFASLLKPGGRLVVADGFAAEEPRTARDETLYRRFLQGWAIPHLCRASEYRAWCEEAGLRAVHDEEITAEVMPHARAIFRFGLLFGPFRWLGRRLGVTSREEWGNVVATYLQFLTLRRGLWAYRIFCHEKD